MAGALSLPAPTAWGITSCSITSTANPRPAAGHMRAASSDRFLYAGGAIGALGVILIWRKIGAFWLGGFITAVGCGLTAISYSLRALLARPIERSPRWALPVRAAAFSGLSVGG